MPSQVKTYYRRRRPGVPTWLAIVLIIVALLLGLVLGYLLRGRVALPVALEPPQQAATTPAPVPEDDDGLPVTPLDAESAADLLSGDADAAPLKGDGASAGEIAADELFAATDEPVVVAEYDGGQVLNTEVFDEYNELTSTYLLAGLAVSENADDLLEEALHRVVSDRIALAKAEEQGLTTLDATDETAIAAEADAAYEEVIAEVLPGFTGDGVSEADARAATIQSLQENEGITADSVREQVRADYWKQKLFDAVTADIQLTDEATEQAYQKLLKDQQAAFDAITDDYEYARMNGEVVVYNPKGYRTVRHILFALDPQSLEQAVPLLEERAGLDAKQDADRIAEIDAALEKLYAPLDEKAKNAQARLAAGEDFETLLAELGEDGQMRAGPVAESGYYIGKDTELWSKGFVTAALALEKPGDVSEPVRSLNGVHLIEYAADVPAGAVPLEEIRPALEAETLDALRAQAYDAQMDAWMKEANVKLYPDRLQ